MKKVQTLSITFEINDGKQTPIFNPFTGEQLVSTDPGDEQELKFSESVVLMFIADYLEDGPSYSHQSISEGDYYGLEDIKQLEQKLRSLEDAYAYMIINVEQYGSFPGDYVGSIFVVRQNNIYWK